MEQAPQSLTLKQRCLNIIASDLGEDTQPLPPPASLSLEGLKLEADAHAALYCQLTTLKVDADREFGPILRQRFSAWMRQHKQENGGTLIEAFDKTAETFFSDYFDLVHESMHQSEISQTVELYREAYYQASPSSDKTDKTYMSLKEFIGAGARTMAEVFPVLLIGINAAIIKQELQLSPPECQALTRRSGHLSVQLAKLSLADFDRFVTYYNDNRAAARNLIAIQQHRGAHLAVFNKEFFENMRQDTQIEAEAYSHRPYHGCAAAVSIYGEQTPLEKLWELSVDALAEAGLW